MSRAKKAKLRHFLTCLMQQSPKKRLLLLWTFPLHHRSEAGVGGRIGLFVAAAAPAELLPRFNSSLPPSCPATYFNATFLHLTRLHCSSGHDKNILSGAVHACLHRVIKPTEVIALV